LFSKRKGKRVGRERKNELERIERVEESTGMGKIGLWYGM
jgi:hypothetical protein